jgi:hypothetical protein
MECSAKTAHNVDEAMLVRLPQVAFFRFDSAVRLLL